MTTPAPRLPELRPRLLGGRGVPAARQLRLRAEDGALVLHRPDGPPRRLSEPGAVQGAVWLDDDRARACLGRRALPGGVLVLRGADGPLLALHPVEWAPPAPAAGRELLATSGATALLTGLGLPPEPTQDADVAGLGDVRRVLLSPLPPLPTPGRATWPLAVLAMVLGFAAWPANGTAAGAVLTVLCLVLTGGLLLAVVRGRAEAAAAQAEPRGGDRVVLPAAPVGLTAGLSAAVLEVGRDDVVVADRGREAWVPGPAAGGITRLVAEPVALRFVDASGADLLRVPTAVFAADDEAGAQVHAACRSAGIDVVTSPLASVTATPAADTLSASVPPSVLQSATERGDPSGEALYAAACGAALGLGGALGVLTWSAPVAALLLLGAVSELGQVAALAARRRRLDRRAVSPTTPATVPA